jgi:sarcosine oxidase subunit gamma
MAEAHGPLDGAPPIGGPDLAVTALPHVAKVTVRGRDATPALVQAVTAALGVAPPVAPNTTARLGARTILWLGPGEWRVVGPPGDESALVDALRHEVPRRLAGVVDVTDCYAALRLAGAGARAVLAQGCPLDLHPRAFGPGHCAQSLLAKADVLIHQSDAAPTYELQVRWSHAQYLWTWLAEAATAR